jgi:signal peptide peptidase SppA
MKDPHFSLQFSPRQITRHTTMKKATSRLVVVFASCLLLVALPDFFFLLRGVAAAAAADSTYDSDDYSSDDDDEGLVVEPPQRENKDVATPKPAGETKRHSDDEDDGIFQRNTDYVEPLSASSTSMIIDDVLAKNQTAVLKSVRRVARFAKTLVTSKTAAASFIALYLLFRMVSFESIMLQIIATFITVRRDVKTGQVEMHWNVKRLFHLVVFLGIVYHAIQTRNEDDTNDTVDENSSSSSLLTTMLLGPGYGAAATLLRRWLRPAGKKPYNAAFVPPIQQHYTFESLNDRYVKDVLALAKASKNKAVVVPTTTVVANNNNNNNNNGTSSSSTTTSVHSNNSTIVVLDWTGLDSSVSNLDTLKDSVSFLLSLSYNDNNTSNFDVVVVLESPGGAAARYAMAAQQLCRLRQSSHDVTVCVDTVAASGGYMIACCASRIIAAPFALVGSIGVVGQSLNVHKVLENWGVRPLVFRGGRDKAPLGLIGEVTDENVAKVQGMVDDTHRAFKRHVVDNRPLLAQNIETIATGDVWFGYDALENGLIDAIGTSDEYLLERMKQGARVLKLQQVIRKGPFGGLTTVEAELGGVPSAKPADLRRRVGAFVAKTLVGADSWRHITSWLAKIDTMLPVQTTTTTQLP